MKRHSRNVGKWESGAATRPAGASGGEPAGAGEAPPGCAVAAALLRLSEQKCRIGGKGVAAMLLLPHHGCRAFGAGAQNGKRDAVASGKENAAGVQAPWLPFSAIASISS